MLNMIFDLVSGAVKSALGSIWLYLCWILAVVSLVLAFYTARLAEKLEIANEEAARSMATANENAAVLNAVKRDFNSSLNACYEDYKTLAGKFDNYRAAITNAQKRAIAIADKNVSCRLVQNAPLIEALNRSSQ
jgi:beta-lactamase regulating signal transducer with metallopeptidase domain